MVCQNCRGEFNKLKTELKAKIALKEKYIDSLRKKLKAKKLTEEDVKKIEQMNKKNMLEGEKNKQERLRLKMEKNSLRKQYDELNQQNQKIVNHLQEQILILTKQNQSLKKSFERQITIAENFEQQATIANKYGKDIDELDKFICAKLDECNEQFSLQASGLEEFLQKKETLSLQEKILVVINLFAQTLSYTSEYNKIRSIIDNVVVGKDKELSFECKVNKLISSYKIIQDMKKPNFRQKVMKEKDKFLSIAKKKKNNNMQLNNEVKGSHTQGFGKKNIQLDLPKTMNNAVKQHKRNLYGDNETTEEDSKIEKKNTKSRNNYININVEEPENKDINIIINESENDTIKEEPKNEDIKTIEDNNINNNQAKIYNNNNQQLNK